MACPDLRASQGPEEEVGSLARACARFPPNFGPRYRRASNGDCGFACLVVPCCPQSLFYGREDIILSRSAQPEDWSGRRSYTPFARPERVPLEGLTRTLSQ